jgi:hypothetical protein
MSDDFARGVADRVAGRPPNPGRTEGFRGPKADRAYKAGYDAAKPVADYAEPLAAAHALISWIEGMCVDEADHMAIREGINRYNTRRGSSEGTHDG